MIKQFKWIGILITTLCYLSVSGQTDFDKFNDHYSIVLKNYVQNGSVNYKMLSEDTVLSQAISHLEKISLEDIEDDKQQLALLINGYNALVMHSITKAYPISSVQEITGFFDKQKHLIAGRSLSLNDLEDNILKGYGEARLHFVLVCGAVDCPPIINEIYKGETLDVQLTQQTSLAINNPNFLSTSAEGYSLSRIFKWYKSDFVKQSGGVLEFINTYKTSPIEESATIDYYSYNWELNDLALGGSSSSNNAFRYVVSSTIRKGGVELKIFNNLYSQKTGSGDELLDRSTFFTTNVSFLYGLGDYFNIGFNGRFRRVHNSSLPSNAFDVLSSGEGQYRTGITGIGPQIRWAPVPKWENFSVQSFFTFAPGDDLEGTGDLPFIDWNRATWVTQFFNDFSIGDNFSVFVDLSFWLEDIGSQDGDINRFSTPLTIIGSYFPTPKWTLYVLSGYAPYYNSDFDSYFRQLGIGTKYQFTPKYEIELLYTDFSNNNLNANNGRAATYNLGFRYNY